jgi:tetratricopeptide (TPR) repeat protein
LWRALGDVTPAGRWTVRVYGPPEERSWRAAGSVVPPRAASGWLTLGGRPAAVEDVLLRLLLRLGGTPRSDLCTALVSRPQELAGLAARACRPRLAAQRPLIVLDHLPDDRPGEKLLRTVTRLMRGTRTSLLVTSRTSHAATGSGPNVPSNGAVQVSESSRELWVTGRRVRLTGPDIALLDGLVAWEGGEFSPDTALPVEAITPLERRTSIERLHEERLLQESRPGWYVLHPAVRERLAHHRDPGELTATARQLDSGLAAALLDEPGELGDTAEPCVDLALRLMRSDDPDSRRFTDWLAHQLAIEGSLLPLLLLKAGLWRATGNHDVLTVPVAVALRQAGRPDLAVEQLAGTDTEAAVRELAVTHHHMGEPERAEAALDTLPAGRPDGWALHTRAAIHIDRGAQDRAGRLLRSAIETHQVRGDRRGEAWAVFHYGRLRLLRGDPEEARKRIDAAWTVFRDLGDVVGAAWADTELCRVALLHRGPQPDVVRDLEAMPATHRRHGDVRGEAWARLWLGVAYADAQRLDEAQHTVTDAVLAFAELPDQLGRAWAVHHLGVLNGDRETLGHALTAFGEAGNGHGRAWTLLQQAVREGPLFGRGVAHRALLEFQALGDVAGEQWAAFSAASPPSDVREQAVRTLAGCYPRHVIEGIARYDRQVAVPHAIRHLIPEPGFFAIPEPGSFAAESPSHGIPPTASRVRLLLVDGPPAIDAALRIVLLVEPGPEHPWSAPGASRPRLTARATPLTRADIEPAESARLDPTVQFRFTPHSTGRHRIRFTIEHEESGAVLQQVETEIDVPGAPVRPAGAGLRRTPAPPAPTRALATHHRPALAPQPAPATHRRPAPAPEPTRRA